MITVNRTLHIYHPDFSYVWQLVYCSVSSSSLPLISFHREGAFPYTGKELGLTATPENPHFHPAQRGITGRLLKLLLLAVPRIRRPYNTRKRLYFSP